LKIANVLIHAERFTVRNSINKFNIYAATVLGSATTDINAFAEDKTPGIPAPG
jgi:hypothetical protein